MISLEKTLAYLCEALSNYLDRDDISKSITQKILAEQFSAEGDFVKALNQDETNYLEHLLTYEIEHAMKSGDFKRVYELNEVYELL